MKNVVLVAERILESVVFTFDIYIFLHRTVQDNRLNMFLFELI